MNDVNLTRVQMLVFFYAHTAVCSVILIDAQATKTLAWNINKK